MGIYGQGWCDGRGGRVHGVGQSWADAKVFASLRPQRESFRVFASPARKHFDDARRATAENDTIVKEAKILRHVRP